IYQDKKGNIWLGTEGAFERFDSKLGIFVHYYPFNEKSNYVSGIVEDEQGNLWLIGLSNKLAKLNTTTNTFEYVQFSDNIELTNEANYGGALLYEGNDIFWIGNPLDGAYRFNTRTGTKEVFSIETGKLKSNEVLCLFKDSENKIWIGTDGGGLYIYNPSASSLETFTHSNDPFTLSSNAIYCIYESQPGLTWVGTFASGLNVVMKRKKFLKFTTVGTHGNALNNKSVLCIAKSTDKKIWLGTDGGGLNLFNPETYKFEYFTEENGKACANVVKSIYVDNENLWYGSFRKGFCNINLKTGQIKEITTATKLTSGSLSRGSVWSIYKDNKDNKDKLWLGLFKSGIDIYDIKNNSISRSPLDTTQNGFAADRIVGILEDDQKNLWLSSDQGILRFNPVNEEVKAFDTEDGL